MAAADGPPTFGRYQLLGLLGKGGTARVYRALRPGPMGFGKEVALKIIDRDASMSEESAMSLVNEARLGCLLRHKNIVSIDELDSVDDTFYIAMEYVDGWPLDQLLVTQAGRGGLVPLATVLEILIEVAEGLEYAHTQTAKDGTPLNIVHRDLKPGNVMVSRRGEVKITDFGTAKATTNVRQTQEGFTRGTPAYMSPEQVTGQPLDGRSDIFSLGALLHEVVTLKMTFPGENLATVMHQVLEGDLRPARDRVASVAPALEPVLKRCMARDPAGRYQSAATVAADLRRIQARVGNRPTVAEWLTGLKDELPVWTTGEFGWEGLPGGGSPGPRTVTEPPQQIAAPEGRAEPAEPAPESGGWEARFFGDVAAEPPSEVSDTGGGGGPGLFDDEPPVDDLFATAHDSPLLWDNESWSAPPSPESAERAPANPPGRAPRPSVGPQEPEQGLHESRPGPGTPGPPTGQRRGPGPRDDRRASPGPLWDTTDPEPPPGSAPGAPPPAPPGLSGPPRPPSVPGGPAPRAEQKAVFGLETTSESAEPLRRTEFGLREERPVRAPPRAPPSTRPKVTRRPSLKARLTLGASIAWKLALLYAGVLLFGPAVGGSTGQSIADLRDWQVGLFTGESSGAPWGERGREVVIGDSAFVEIPAGRVRLGTVDGEGPARASAAVDVPAFRMMRTEVSVDAYRTSCPRQWYQLSCPDWSPERWQSGNHAAVRVTWQQAADWCQAQGWRLPTETEWEYAARGEAGRKHPWGDEFTEGAMNYCDKGCSGKVFDLTGEDDGQPRTAPVGSFGAGATEQGVLDLAGNASEWTLDCWTDRHEERRSWHASKTSTCRRRVARGGSWKDTVDRQTGWERFEADPNLPAERIGFRCVQGESPHPE